LHLVGILFPHINDDARSKAHQKCTGLITRRGWIILKLKYLYLLSTTC